MVEHYGFRISRKTAHAPCRDRSKVCRRRHGWSAEILVIEIAQHMPDDELRYRRRKPIAGGGRPSDQAFGRFEENGYTFLLELL
jgi:hypothetical protein